MNHLQPGPLIITLGTCRKLSEIFASQGVPPVSTTPVENLSRCQQQNANNRINAKKGTPTSEGTPTSVVTLGAEGMLITAEPRQQQKSQLQHEL